MSSSNPRPPERWLPVVGWEATHEVSSHGRVRTKDRVIVRSNGHLRRCLSIVLKFGRDRRGYANVSLCDAGRRKTASVHRLVAEAFLPRCIGKDFVNHIDGDKSNPDLENLEWVTPKENIAHAKSLGLGDFKPPQPIGTARPNAKLNPERVAVLRAGKPLRAAAREWGICVKTLRNARNGVTWKEVTT